MKKYDYLIVGAGLYGATFANLMTLKGARCLVIDKKDDFGGNCQDYMDDNILVHQHGAHIFHTSDKSIWTYVNQFATFRQFQNNVKAMSHNKVYSLPFNMNTFEQIWSCVSPSHAKRIIQEEIDFEKIGLPKNLEEQALKLVGRSIYELLIRDYTEKQWGRSCTELPADIIKRIPLRFTFDNNYFNDIYQGIPERGYTAMVMKMLRCVDTELKTDFKDIGDWRKIATKLVYTGPLDEYFNHEHGRFDWRTLKFETEKLDIDNYQGCPVMNYCDHSRNYTRVIEHKHFLKDKSDRTIITREYPKSFEIGDEPYYPIRDDKNMMLLSKYVERVENERNVIFGGRLGTYQYLDMDKVIAQASRDVISELKS